MSEASWNLELLEHICAHTADKLLKLLHSHSLVEVPELNARHALTESLNAVRLQVCLVDVLCLHVLVGVCELSARSERK